MEFIHGTKKGTFSTDFPTENDQVTTEIHDVLLQYWQ